MPSAADSLESKTKTNENWKISPLLASARSGRAETSQSITLGRKIQLLDDRPVERCAPLTLGHLPPSCRAESQAEHCGHGRSWTMQVNLPV